MENILIFVSILVVLELGEAYIQRADTLYAVMEKLYVWYKKSIFAFFLIHPSFYFVLLVVVATDVLNIYMILILSFKIFDLFYKIELIKTIFIKQNVPAETFSNVRVADTLLVLSHRCDTLPTVTFLCTDVV